MGRARTVMDRVTAAVVAKDLKALGECYAADASAITPDQGQIDGRDAIVAYLQDFVDAFSDLHFEMIAEHESGYVAIDEGYVIGTHTGPLRSPDGETIPPTARASGCAAQTC